MSATASVKAWRVHGQLRNGEKNDIIQVKVPAEIDIVRVSAAQKAVVISGDNDEVAGALNGVVEILGIQHSAIGTE